MATSGRKNHCRSKNFRSRSIAWVAHVMSECHVTKKQFKFWKKDGSFMTGEQLATHQDEPGPEVSARQDVYACVDIVLDRLGIDDGGAERRHAAG